jgi:nitrate reductase alpha subunit
MEKKSFIFYTSWKKNIEMMEDDELRRFINNLINHTEGNEVDLPTRMEKMVWNDLVEVLNHNERKRERAAERSRQNGQRGGRPTKPNETHNNPIGYNKTQQDIEEPDGINNNLNNLLMGNGKLLMENGKGSMVNGVIVNGVIDIFKQEMDILEEKKKNNGWNSLSVKEAARYYELVKEIKTK